MCSIEKPKYKTNSSGASPNRHTTTKSQSKNEIMENHNYHNPVESPQPINFNSKVVENEFISVTPGFLQFPHDDESQHIKRIVVWNKTKSFLTFRIEPPKSKYFKIFYEMNGIYGGTETHIIIKCKPYEQKMCFDHLTIHINNQITKNIKIPLEIIPSISWFSLPRVIVIENTPIGSCSEYIIQLPNPPTSNETYNFFLSGNKPKEMEVSPTEGRIGPGFIERIILKYTPKSYTTRNYQLSIHFPQIVVQPFKINVCMRCAPGLESTVIAQTTDKIINEKSLEFKAANDTITKSVKPSPCRENKPTKSQGPIESEESQLVKKPDLCTPAGVMKFLLEKGGKVAWAQEYLGPLGITSFEEQRIYKTKEKEFHDKYTKLELQQKNMMIQPTKIIHGEDPIESQPDKLEEIKMEREQANLAYQKALGLRDNDIEDMTRRKLKAVRIRMIRDAHTSYKKSPESKTSIQTLLPVSTKFESKAEVSNASQWVRKIALKKFIQTALIIITRKRADKRIIKLKKLIKQTIQERKEAEEELKAKQLRETRQIELEALKGLQSSSSQTDFLSKLIHLNEEGESKEAAAADADDETNQEIKSQKQRKSTMHGKSFDKSKSEKFKKSSAIKKVSAVNK